MLVVDGELDEAGRQRVARFFDEVSANFSGKSAGARLAQQNMSSDSLKWLGWEKGYVARFQLKDTANLTLGEALSEIYRLFPGLTAADIHDILVENEQGRECERL